MAAPNIVGVTTIIGITTMVGIANTNTANVIVSNATNSNRVLKINSLIASNKNGTLSADVTVRVTDQAAGAGNAFNIVSTVSVPADASLAVIAKDTTIYLEENRSIVALASTSNYIDIICSYEQIS
tara:strand:- start:135 stop:512 length:378 start_codon:yes stop_codon:yes gene_type:complete